MMTATECLFMHRNPCTPPCNWLRVYMQLLQVLYLGELLPDQELSCPENILTRCSLAQQQVPDQELT